MNTGDEFPQTQLKRSKMRFKRWLNFDEAEPIIRKRRAFQLTF